MGNASARDWDPTIGKRFNPLETVNMHTHCEHLICNDVLKDLMVVACGFIHDGPQDWLN